MQEKHYPPPQKHPTFEIKNQNKGIEDILDTYFLFTQTFFLNVGNGIKQKILYTKILKILFFSIFKKFIKNSNIPSLSKTIQHTPMTWCTYLQSFEKIHPCVFRVTVRKLNVADGQMDRQMDRQTDGRGHCNISRPVFFCFWKSHYYSIMYGICQNSHEKLTKRVIISCLMLKNMENKLSTFYAAVIRNNYLLT